MSEVAQSDTGVYRSIKAWLFPGVLVILWAIGGFLCAQLWSDVRDHATRITQVETKQLALEAGYTEIKEAIKEIRQDVKEILKEMRK